MKPIFEDCKKLCARIASPCQVGLSPCSPSCLALIAFTTVAAALGLELEVEVEVDAWQVVGNGQRSATNTTTGSGN